MLSINKISENNNRKIPGKQVPISSKAQTNQCNRKNDRNSGPKPKALNKRLYSIKEAAVYLGRSEWAVREMIWAGKIPYVKDGKRILLDVKDMEFWIERNKTRYVY